MATDEDAATSVRRWIEKTGFPLQMRTAHEISKAGPALLEQGGYYRDPITGVWREFDVVAEWCGQRSRTGINIKACIECKKGAGIWVIFADDAISVSSDWSGNIVDNSILEQSASVTEEDVQGFRDRITQSALQSFHFNDSIGAFVKGAHAKEDEPYEAVRQAVSTARGLASEEVRAYSGSAETTICLAIPIVVTESKLFKCELDTMTGEYSVVECSAISVRAPRDEATTDLTPTVKIVNCEALAELVDGLVGALYVIE